MGESEMTKKQCNFLPTEDVAEKLANVQKRMRAHTINAALRAYFGINVGKSETATRVDELERRVAILEMQHVIYGRNT